MVISNNFSWLYFNQLIARLIFFCFFCLIGLALPAAANVGLPNFGGTAGTEPNGLANIYITHENLNIDLRGLASVENNENKAKVLVDAEYEIENRGASQNLTLVFVFGSGYEDFHVYFDETETPTDFAPVTDKLPRDWEIPKKTPWKNGRELEYSIKYDSSRRAFSLTIPAGKHKLRAHYRGAPSYYIGTPLKYWQFAYVLAPARQWAGFGNLDVKIDAPENWTVVTTPELTREGTRLKGHFDKIPADAVTLTAQSNLPASYQEIEGLSWIVIFLVFIGFPILMVIYTAWRGYKIKYWWILGLILPVIWAALIFGAGYLAVWGASYTIPGGQYSEYGYGSGLEMLLVIGLTIAALPVGVVLWFLTVWITTKVRKPKMENIK